MPKPKILQKDKRQLLKIFKSEQKEKWCELIKRIRDEGKTLTVDIDNRLDVLRTEVNKAQAEIWELETQKNTILMDNKLKVNFSMESYFYNRDYACKLNELHPDILEFITEWRQKEKELLLIGHEEA